MALLAGLTLASGWVLLYAQTRLKGDQGEIVDAIDALLPQTQCAQCGYPGCRPYAQAVAAGAAIDLCPPGGQATFEALKALLDRSGGIAPPAPEPALAQIREADCIGCFLCVRACPVDAIIGAPGFMHTVIEDECTGCELCLPACPVDCIDLVVATEMGHPPSLPGDKGTPTGEKGTPTFTAKGTPTEKGTPTRAARPCIGCNRCEPVCPAHLAPRELLWLSSAGKWQAAASLGLERCIECRLCDRACPSDIPLAHIFGNGKSVLADAAAKSAQAVRTKARFEARAARLHAERDAAQARRGERLARQKRLVERGDSLWQ